MLVCAVYVLQFCMLFDDLLLTLVCFSGESDERRHGLAAHGAQDDGHAAQVANLNRSSGSSRGGKMSVRMMSKFGTLLYHFFILF